MERKSKYENQFRIMDTSRINLAFISVYYFYLILFHFMSKQFNTKNFMSFIIDAITVM